MSFYANYSSALGSGGGGGGGPFLPLAGGTMTGDINLGGHNITNGGVIGQGTTVHTVTNGETFGISNGWATVTLYATTTIAAQTTEMPPNPVIGQTITITMVGGGSITAWTLEPWPGQTIYGTIPTTISSGQTFQYSYLVIGPTHYWVPILSNLGGSPYLPLTGGTLSGNLTFTPDGTVSIGTPDAGTTLERPLSGYFQNKISIGQSYGPSDSPSLWFGGSSDALFARLYLDANGSSNLILDASNCNAFQVIGQANFGGLGCSVFSAGSAGITGVVSAGSIFTNPSSTSYIYANSSSIPPSAVLGADSTTKGLLPPRMNTTQKNAITSPAEGLVVYDNTLHKLCVYTGSKWETVTSV